MMKIILCLLAFVICVVGQPTCYAVCNLPIGLDCMIYNGYSFVATGTVYYGSYSTAFCKSENHGICGIGTLGNRYCASIYGQTGAITTPTILTNQSFQPNTDCTINSGPSIIVTPSLIVTISNSYIYNQGLPFNPIAFDTILLDNSNTYDTTTYTYKIPQAGFYQIISKNTFHMSQSLTYYAEFDIMDNCTQKLSLNLFSGTTGTVGLNTFTTNQIIYLNFNQNIQLCFFNVLGGSKSVVLDVNLNQLYLWGTSYSGGHVLQVAGTYPDKLKIAGVISQVPFVSGIVTALNVIMRSPPLWSIQAPAAALKDLIRSKIGLSRHYFPIYKVQSDLGILSVPDIQYEFEEFLIVPDSWKVWKNYATAWSGLQFALYNPNIYVKEIESPVLFVITSDDTLVPPSAARDASKKIKNCSVKEISSAHFDVYKGQLFEQTVNYEIEWLKSQINSKK